MSYTAGYGSNVAFNDRQWDFENIFLAKSLRLSHLEGLYAVEQCVALVWTAEFNPALLSLSSFCKAWGNQY